MSHINLQYSSISPKADSYDTCSRRAEVMLETAVFLYVHAIFSVFNNYRHFATCEIFLGSLWPARICIPFLLWYYVTEFDFSNVLSKLSWLSYYITVDLQYTVLQILIKMICHFHNYFSKSYFVKVSLEATNARHWDHFKFTAFLWMRDSIKPGSLYVKLEHLQSPRQLLKL